MHLRKRKADKWARKKELREAPCSSSIIFCPIYIQPYPWYIYYIYPTFTLWIRAQGSKTVQGLCTDIINQNNIGHKHSLFIHKHTVIYTKTQLYTQTHSYIHKYTLFTHKHTLFIRKNTVFIHKHILFIHKHTVFIHKKHSFYTQTHTFHTQTHRLYTNTHFYTQTHSFYTQTHTFYTQTLNTFPPWITIEDYWRMILIYGSQPFLLLFHQKIIVFCENIGIC